jgi:tetratricopeptide (TPR) repeat protein
VTPGSTDRLQELERDLDAARTARAPSVIAQITRAIGQLHAEQFNLHDARLRYKEAVDVLRTLDDKEQLAKALVDLAVTNTYLGNGDVALVDAREASSLARDAGTLSLYGYSLCSLGAVLCYTGQYRAGFGALGEAQAVFIQAGDEVGIVHQAMLLAREYTRDLGQCGAAASELEKALPVLREKAPVRIVLEGLLALADSTLRQGNLTRADAVLAEIDSLVIQGKRYWYRPELYLIRAQAAVAADQIEQARQHAYKGLSAVGDYGDLRMLAPLYRTLGTILGRDRSRADDAYDALERAMAVGRVRARKIDLALALQQAGLHLKRFASRPTLRARGSGFLFEADSLFGEMGIPAPKPARPGAAPPGQ